MANKQMTLCYWNIRGLGSSIRNLLRYVGADYQDVSVEFAGAPNYRENWLKVKYTLGLDFPNLPYLVDGDLKLTQVSANCNCLQTMVWRQIDLY